MLSEGFREKIGLLLLLFCCLQPFLVSSGRAGKGVIGKLHSLCFKGKGAKRCCRSASERTLGFVVVVVVYTPVLSRGEEWGKVLSEGLKENIEPLSDLCLQPCFVSGGRMGRGVVRGLQSEHWYFVVVVVVVVYSFVLSQGVGWGRASLGGFRKNIGFFCCLQSCLKGKDGERCCQRTSGREERGRDAIGGPKRGH